MQVGDLVIYKKEYRNCSHVTRPSVGVIIDTKALGMRMLVEWNYGERHWRHVNVLEAICK